MKEVQIVYDFDGTLTPRTVPFYPILEKAGMSEKAFYNKVASLKKNGINDIYESWFRSLLEIVQNSSLESHDVTMGAKDTIFCNGVEDWFDNLKKEGKSKFSHYIITSGLEEFIYATKISKHISKVFGATFIHENNTLKDIEKLISDKEKVDYIKKINVLHRRDKDDCTNLIYIGDGLTDYFAMEFVFHNGGTSILVTPSNKKQEEKLFSVTNFQCAADYSIDKELFKYIKKF